MDVFKLSRNFFDWSFENPEKITPSHTALYFFAIEHCNRLGWKEKFGFPSQMAMEAIGIKSYNTYSKIFTDLIEWEFFTLIQKSVNQYSANIIAISKIDKASDKALDKAMIKHKGKQRESTSESNDSIDIHNTNVPETNKQETDTNVSSQAIVPLDNRNKGTQRIIDIVKSQVELEGFLYDNNKEERNRATIIAKRQSDWGTFIKEESEEKEEYIIRSIISYSNQNEYTSKIRSAKDFHEKWKRVANTMKESGKEAEKNMPNPNPLLRFTR